MERTQRSIHGMGKELPFNGLGHTFAPVLARAAKTMLIPVLSEPQTDVAVCAPCYLKQAPRHSGFALLVALGREIRGR